MKIVLQTTIIFLLAIKSYSQSYQWSINYGGTGISSAQILSTVTDPAGNIYSTGCFAGTIDFDPGPGVLNMTSLGADADAFVTKTNSSGTLIFARRFGSLGSYTCGFTILVDTGGNIYFSGISSNTADFDPSSSVYNLVSMPETDPFICKLTQWGTLLWVKNINTHNHDQANYLALDATGNPTLAGSYGGTGIDFDPGPGTEIHDAAGSTDGFLLTLDTAGNYIRVLMISGPARDGINTVAFDTNGDIFISGSFSVSTDLDPGINIVTAVSNGSSDFYIVKLDSGGNYLWSKTIGGPNGEGTGDLKIGTSGDLYLTGGFSGTLDFDPSPSISTLTATGSTDGFYLKRDSAGNYVWSKRIGGIWGSYLNGIVLDANDNIYGVGFFYRTIDLDPGPAVKQFTNNGIPDIFVEMLDSAGTYRWGYTVGSNGSDLGFSITMDAQCQLYVSGTFTDSVDFYPGSGVSALKSRSSYFDAFLQKMNNLGGACATPLPIELISFDATLIQSSAKLKWTTASEQNNSYFTILRSRDGIIYEEIGRVEGSGNSTHERSYYFDDGEPFSPYTYYRLKQTDFDGTTTIAGNTFIMIKSREDINMNWNMNANIFSIRIPENKKNENFSELIYSSNGELIHSEIINANHDLLLNNLSPGIYIAALTGFDSIHKYMFIVTR